MFTLRHDFMCQFVVTKHTIIYQYQEYQIILRSHRIIFKCLCFSSLKIKAAVSWTDTSNLSRKLCQLLLCCLVPNTYRTRISGHVPPRGYHCFPLLYALKSAMSLIIVHQALFCSLKVLAFLFDCHIYIATHHINYTKYNYIYIQCVLLLQDVCRLFIFGYLIHKSLIISKMVDTRMSSLKSLLFKKYAKMLRILLGYFCFVHISGKEFLPSYSLIN